VGVVAVGSGSVGTAVGGSVGFVVAVGADVGGVVGGSDVGSGAGVGVALRVEQADSTKMSKSILKRRNMAGFLLLWVISTSYGFWFYNKRASFVGEPRFQPYFI